MYRFIIAHTFSITFKLGDLGSALNQLMPFHCSAWQKSNILVNRANFAYVYVYIGLKIDSISSRMCAD